MENLFAFYTNDKNLKKQSFQQPQRNNGNGCTTIYLAPVTEKEIYGPYAQGLRNGTGKKLIPCGRFLMANYGLSQLEQSSQNQCIP